MYSRPAAAVGAVTFVTSALKIVAVVVTGETISYFALIPSGKVRLSMMTVLFSPTFLSVKCPSAFAPVMSSPETRPLLMATVNVAVVSPV